MKISDVIKNLEAIKKHYGNIPVIMEIPKKIKKQINSLGRLGTITVSDFIMASEEGRPIIKSVLLKP